ncbi:MAG: hypothetical protein ACYS18_02110 [Planctomycetota bacterium]|jgi:hypothetical protein
MNKKNSLLLGIIIAAVCFMTICSAFEFLFLMTFMHQLIGLVVVIIATNRLISNLQKKQYGTGEQNNTAGLSSLFSGAICCLYAALSTVHLYIYGYGQAIRPMAWAGFVFNVELIAIASGLFFSIIGQIKDKEKIYSGVGLILAFCPFLVSLFLLHLGVLLGIYTLKP